MNAGRHKAMMTDIKQRTAAFGELIASSAKQLLAGGRCPPVIKMLSWGQLLLESE